MLRHGFAWSGVLVVGLAFGGRAPGHTMWYVDCDDCTPPGTGTPGNPFCSIQDGIDAASDSDTVLIAPGTCNEVINFNGKGIALRSSHGPDVTVIDGSDLGDSVVKCVGGEGNETILEGFTIQNGIGEEQGGYTFGGGMIIVGSHCMVRKCVFLNNSAGNGGALYCSAGGEPSLSDCQFIGNEATTTGVPEGRGGGGVFIDGSSPTFANCLFLGNSCVNNGDGVYNWDGSTPEFRNCTFVSNRASPPSGWGGGMFNADSAPPSYPDPSYPVLTNCILWDNEDGGGVDESAQVHDAGNSASEITCTCLQECDMYCSEPDWHNIGDDPLFVTGPEGGFYLSQIAAGQGADSPCVDSGCGPASAVYSHGTTRTDHVDDSGIVDMGFHYSAELRSTPIPAVSEWGLVAMTLLVLRAGTLVYVGR